MVNLPNGDIAQSSHIAEVDLPQLPSTGRAAHVIPRLESHSLVSVVKLCNAGCQVEVKDISREIWYGGKIIVRCSKDVRTGLWMMPITNIIEGDNALLNERKTTTTPELVLAGISHHVNPTIQTVATSELDWASCVLQ